MNKTDQIVIVNKRTEIKNENGKWAATELYSPEEITLERFKQAYIVERWKNERRYGLTATIYGLFHTKTIVKFDDSLRVVRTFDFSNIK